MVRPATLQLDRHCTGPVSAEMPFEWDPKVPVAGKRMWHRLWCLLSWSTEDRGKSSMLFLPLASLLCIVATVKPRSPEFKPEKPGREQDA